MVPPSKTKIYDLFHLETIYNEKFNYFLPSNLLVNYLNGTEFGRITPYTENELQQLQEEYAGIRKSVLIDELPYTKNIKGKVDLITAGAPGAGKTYLLNQILKTQKAKNHVFGYHDPDDVYLRCMENTYWKMVRDEVQQGKDELSSKQKAYEKFRPASNEFFNLGLATNLSQGKNVAIGTTLTSARISNLLEFLEKNNYEIQLIHVSAPKDVRIDSVKIRDQSFVQTTSNDIETKGHLFTQRIHDYMKYGSKIDFYYRRAADEDAILAATLQGKLKKREIKIINRESWDQVKNLHNATCQQLGLDSSYLWENAVEKQVVNILDASEIKKT
ncbi:MAG: hypothetical protein Tsb0021_05980 [Chlamydiales bacterium]